MSHYQMKREITAKEIAAMASSNKNETTTSNSVDREIDAELDELLDDALEDFSSGNENTGVPPTIPKPQNKAAAKDGTTDGTDPISDMFAEDFSDEMAKQFEEAMQTLMSDDPGMLQQIEKLAEAAGTAGDSKDSQVNFQKTLKETLSSLAQNTENLQDGAGGGVGGDGMVPEEMMKMFEGMGLEGAGEDAGFMPMMQGMMKTLLSKEVLYPSLKEIAEKYPDWLKENKGKVTEASYKKYEKQHSIIVNILKEFDEEKPSDTDAVKNKRHESIMNKMQEMQDLGQPPKDIVGEMAPGLNFDENGVPKFPGSSDACSIM